MKNVFTWMRVILFALLLIFLTLMLVAILPMLFEKDGRLQGTEIRVVLVGFFVLSYFILIWALRRNIKKLRMAEATATVVYNGELNIHFETKIDFVSYRNLIFGLTFKKPGYLVIIGIFLFYLLTSFYANEFLNFEYESIFPIIVFLIVIPFVLYLQTKKLYDSNKFLHESVDYHLTKENIVLKSETVNSTISWTALHKIKETKSFFMLYTNAAVAVLIDKRKMTSQEMEQLRGFIQSLNVPKE